MSYFHWKAVSLQNSQPAAIGSYGYFLPEFAFYNKAVQVGTLVTNTSLTSMACRQLLFPRVCQAGQDQVFLLLPRSKSKCLRYYCTTHLCQCRNTENVFILKAATCISHRIFCHYKALLTGGDELVSDINPKTSKSFFFVCGGFFHIRKQLISWRLWTVKNKHTHFFSFPQSILCRGYHTKIQWYKSQWTCRHVYSWCILRA